MDKMSYLMHSFKTRLGHRLGGGTGSLGQWSNRMTEPKPLG